MFSIVWLNLKTYYNSDLHNLQRQTDISEKHHKKCTIVQTGFNCQTLQVHVDIFIRLIYAVPRLKLARIVVTILKLLLITGAGGDTLSDPFPVNIKLLMCITQKQFKSC